MEATLLIGNSGQSGILLKTLTACMCTDYNIAASPPRNSEQSSTLKTALADGVIHVNVFL